MRLHILIANYLHLPGSLNGTRMNMKPVLNIESLYFRTKDFDSSLTALISSVRNKTHLTHLSRSITKKH